MADTAKLGVEIEFNPYTLPYSDPAESQASPDPGHSADEKLRLFSPLSPLTPVRRPPSPPGPPTLTPASTHLQGRFFKPRRRATALIIILYLLAALAAIGHHLLNTHLDGRAITEPGGIYDSPHFKAVLGQNWANSAATALAFLFKAFLTASVAYAFWQRAWQLARTADISIQSYDAIFGTLHSPLTFTERALWSAQCSLALISLLAWLLPITSIFTPGSLRTTLLTTATPTTCILPALGNLRKANATGSGAYDLVNTDLSGGYVGPTGRGENVLHRTFVAQAHVPWASPCPPASDDSALGAGNCDYDLTFDGLGLECAVDAFDPQALIQQNANMFYVANATTVPVNTSEDLADAHRGLVGGASLGNASLDVITISQAVLDIAWLDTTEEQPDYKSLRCVPTNTTYFVRMQQRGPAQTVSLQRATKNARIIGKGFSRNYTRDWLVADRITDPLSAVNDVLNVQMTSGTSAGPEAGTLHRHPGTGQWDLEVFTNAAYSDLFIDIEETATTNSYKISNWTIGDLGRLLPELAFNMSLSLLSIPFANTSGPCTAYATRQVYTYRSRTLWLPYGIALVLVLPVLVAGLVALHANGYAGDNAFSLILESARGGGLDELFDGRSSNSRETESSEGAWSEKDSISREVAEMETKKRIYRARLRFHAESSTQRGFFTVVDSDAASP